MSVSIPNQLLRDIKEYLLTQIASKIDHDVESELYTRILSEEAEQTLQELELKDDSSDKRTGLWIV